MVDDRIAAFLSDLLRSVSAPVASNSFVQLCTSQLMTAFPLLPS